MATDTRKMAEVVLKMRDFNDALQLLKQAVDAGEGVTLSRTQAEGTLYALHVMAADRESDDR